MAISGGKLRRTQTRPVMLSVRIVASAAKHSDASCPGKIGDVMFMFKGFYRTKFVQIVVSDV